MNPQVPPPKGSIARTWVYYTRNSEIPYSYLSFCSCCLLYGIYYKHLKKNWSKTWLSGICIMVSGKQKILNLWVGMFLTCNSHDKILLWLKGLKSILLLKCNHCCDGGGSVGLQVRCGSESPITSDHRTPKKMLWNLGAECAVMCSEWGRLWTSPQNKGATQISHQDLLKTWPPIQSD